MSEHEYTPKSKFGKWFNDRLPLLSLASHLTDYPTPKNLNYWWTFGGILTFCLITQIVTGLTLAMHYIAHAAPILCCEIMCIKSILFNILS